MTVVEEMERALVGRRAEAEVFILGSEAHQELMLYVESLQPYKHASEIVTVDKFHDVPVVKASNYALPTVVELHYREGHGYGAQPIIIRIRS